MNILKKTTKCLQEKLKNLVPIGIIIYTKRLHSNERKIDYQKRFIKFNISSSDKVLDVGSGGEPFPLATHLVDKNPGETQHRYNSLKTNGLPFTVADVEKLPFKNKEFDFVYCAHVLEHTNNPAKACDELMRVGKRGYIEVPTKVSDIMFNFAKIPKFHKWYVEMVGNSLIFIEYPDYLRKDTADNVFFDLAHSKTDNPIRNMYRKNKNLFSNMFLWKEHFNYYIYDKKGRLIKLREIKRSKE